MAETPSKSSSLQEPTKPVSRHIVVNVAHTQYDVVRTVARQVANGRLISHESSSDWDLLWTDSYISPDTLAKMKPYQKVNRFPGTYQITRKNYLAKNLNKMRKVHPTDFDFYPRTWMLPFDFAELKQAGSSVYIVKPEAGAQGKGIFLIASAEDLPADDKCVVQEYIRDPLLLDGFKFDLRVYVLLTGCSPLRAFVHQEGLVRLATEPYAPPTLSNFDEQFMHLTNYAINKAHPSFTEGATGHKRSLSETLRNFQAEGWDADGLWRDIKQMIVKTLCVIQPSLAHTYRACQPKEPTNSMCFELLGFDILIDRQFKPWLLEVNHSPSFRIDSAIDEYIKTQVLQDTFQLLHLDPDLKKNYLVAHKQELLRSVLRKSKQQDREQHNLEIAVAQAQRDCWERHHLGGFQRVDEEEEFGHLFQSATVLWERWTGTVVRPPPLHASLQPSVNSPLKAPTKSGHSRIRSMHAPEPREAQRQSPSEARSARVSGILKTIELERRVLGRLCPRLLGGSGPTQAPNLRHQRILFSRFDPTKSRSARQQ